MQLLRTVWQQLAGHWPTGLSGVQWPFASHSGPVNFICSVKETVGHESIRLSFGP